MGCGGSKVNSVDAESVDGGDTEHLSPGNGIKASRNEESEQKAVQFSSEIQSNGIAPNEGRRSIHRPNI
jgi:hypothetical protein